MYVILDGFADDPFGDPKVNGDPYCTLFIAHLSHLTTEQTLHKVSFLFFFFLVYILIWVLISYLYM